jgi:hypothetical protein
MIFPSVIPRNNHFGASNASALIGRMSFGWLPAR